MNLIVAHLLLNGLGEEDAFWMLLTLCESVARAANLLSRLGLPL